VPLWYYQVYQYQEEYDLALVGYARATALDPTFTLAKEKYDILVQYLSSVTHMVETKVFLFYFLLRVYTCYVSYDKRCCCDIIIIIINCFNIEQYKSKVHVVSRAFMTINRHL